MNFHDKIVVILIPELGSISNDRSEYSHFSWLNKIETFKSSEIGIVTTTYSLLKPVIGLSK